jgi:CHAT domain-containing protein
VALFNLATAKFISCQVNGTYLDTTISLFQDALDLRPTGHPDRTTTQLHLAAAFLCRFAKGGFQADADAAEELLNEILDVCHTESYIYRAALLAIETYALPSQNTDANDLMEEGPIAPMLPLSLHELARSVERCQHIDDPDALDEAISLHYDALKYYSRVHDERGGLLCNLGSVLYLRFMRRGNDHDLDKAIIFHREALSLLPVGHPGRSVSLNNLACALAVSFAHRGGGEELDEVIVLYREVLDLQPVGHPVRAASLNNLADVLCTRFKRRGNDKDLDEAITLVRAVLDLWPVGHPHRPKSLNNLARALSSRSQHRDDGEDLDAAIACHREALDLWPVGHPDRSTSLCNLANDLFTRFEQRGIDKDLNEAITLHKQALDLLPVGHPGRSDTLNNLGNELSSRFTHRSSENDINEVITIYREVLALYPVGHPHRSESLNNLASALSTCFQQQGNEEQLDEAIALHREALDLWPVTHPSRSASLNNLANALSNRFRQRGNDQDLDQATLLHREALDLYPFGHPHRSTSLYNLANVLSLCFQYRGSEKDLDEAITLHREALDLRPVGHPDRSTSLDDLASALFDHFMHRGNDKDLDEAITLHRDALALRPVGHLHRSRPMDNLATVLCERFQQRGDERDLNEAIMLHQQALDLLPFGHPDRPDSLNNLANALSTRFRHQKNGEDLDKSILVYGEALTLQSVTHPRRPLLFNNLATALTDRFVERGKDSDDLEKALVNAYSALSLFTTNDPHRSVVHGSLATIHILFHQSSTSEDIDSLNAAMDHFRAGADSVSNGLLSRLQTSLRWVDNADRYTHGTLLEAYATSIQLLDAHMSATASVSSRHHVMKLFPRTLAVDAASCALHRGDVCRTVELLEQGRTLIWTQMARFRMPLDNLQDRNDHSEALVKRFRELSSVLDKHDAHLRDGIARVEAEAEAMRYTRLVTDWQEVVQDIRKLEGFSRFMLPPLFSDLQSAARDGPIIVLIASKSSCDAIIILHQQSLVSVHLATDITKLQQLVATLRQTVQRDIGPKEPQGKLIAVLRELWADVVCPVVENLDRLALRPSRILWCPTSFFNFLPLHAAGEYRRGGKNLSKLFISSYTPSLTALIRARTNRDRSQTAPFAAIGQNHPAGFKFPLEAVEPELELVRSLLPPAPTVSFTKVTSVESTKSRALGTLRDNHWIHFACHGTQNLTEPFKSAFLMRDQPLNLLDITQTDLSRHQFAFLSACETAVGNFETPDEVIHLAAALQFAGVKSVIGTFWSVQDSTVQRLVEAFYTNFCGDGKMNSKRAARALHMAVQSLANDKDIALDQRVVFMHIGI